MPMFGRGLVKGYGSRKKFFSKNVPPTFSSTSFMVSDLTFNYLIHLDFIFVRGMREESSLTFLHTVF